jgi:hypothetical protein
MRNFVSSTLRIAAVAGALLAVPLAVSSPADAAWHGGWGWHGGGGGWHGGWGWHAGWGWRGGWGWHRGVWGCCWRGGVFIGAPPVYVAPPAYYPPPPVYYVP